MSRPVKRETTGKHVGYGKVILFGEHFVVHGAPAIVAGISEYTACRLEATPGVPGLQVDDRRPAIPGYITQKREEQKRAHQLVLDHLHIDVSKDGLKVLLGGPLVPSSGIGASASDVVAFSRALSELYGLRLTEDQVNQSAFAGECGYHGTPSGVDNTAATFGGLISYRRDGGKSVFSPIRFEQPLYLVVVGTGITASTTAVVGDVRKMKESDPQTFSRLCRNYSHVVAQARDALQKGDLRAVGGLMNANHDLCRDLHVSCNELEAIVRTCRGYGALGAKLSGTGRGGIAVALAENAEQRDKIVAGLKADCPEAKFVWKYTVVPSAAASL
ncbi:putative mevalonate kinase [Leptomonas pyrrhocoris]|uniref:Mevalonate kinase n=1 Tax=Leptomonas pyrrhocoris TaxID=157538 RepID=A0A0N1J479_LEPPY|nr:putative mevalonate kinase [Leptomonas pyrrhocoris]XP_015652353.1 putative mevalonate kinase [Leptomonas pyrrhocoris]XP_015652355.1 putative mevalonate kinase [Leptomonas pyrrhocoris]XP_015652356.1 putative mevalonate kinase [Leptomonas pyrrhocoris]XP_015652357.1 putative mevalonate kinase [Leptomonas pyrrhocoris]XP_015652358.1 putative mevalonate kinase [Leptomonas pyrrhocoris]XP_015652360.1 putative mevalonate kinase [Leptomonas pyrrhocoris]XP_015652361.1 putative mevalonate kinase [Lep|eukprot:XP_015652352.1 putative mevalonate kinase [Leptomonas pyrrhocoris]